MPAWGSWDSAGLLHRPTAFVPQRPGTGPAFLNSEWNFPWFGTVRGRVGFTPDTARQWMFYVTGGLAFGEANNSVHDQILRVGVNYHFGGPFMTEQ